MALYGSRVGVYTLVRLGTRLRGATLGNPDSAPPVCIAPWQRKVDAMDSDSVVEEQALDGSQNSVPKKSGVKRKQKSSSEMSEYIEKLVENLNTDDFISSIEEHPALWNSSIPDYSDNVMKEKAWSDVCLKVDPEFETRNGSEKNLLCKYTLFTLYTIRFFLSI